MQFYYRIYIKHIIKQDDQDLLDLMKSLSQVAWRHINLIGKYKFCLNQNTINIQELIESAITNSEINFTSETLN